MPLAPWKNTDVIPTYPLQPRNPARPDLLEISRGGAAGGGLDFSNCLVPHRKDYYLLVLVRRGSSRHWVDMRPYTLQPDMFYSTTPRQVHLKESLEPLDGTALAFAPDFLRLSDLETLTQLPLLSNPANGHELRLQPADIVFLEDVFGRLQAEHDQQRPWRTEMLRADLKTALIYLSRLYQAQYGDAAPAEPPLLERFTALLEAHHHALHQVADYAALLHLSAGHLNERIKQQSGQTPLALIQARRALEAKRYLFHTELNVAEVAFALGFEDPSYFGRFFRRSTGQTPMLYRAATREMYQQNGRLSG